jgi:small subunit ribosomal protein S21
VVGNIVQDGEPIDRALRRFKKKYERAGILREFRRRTAFEKPSVKNKMMLQRAARRQQRMQEEQG